MRYAFIVLAGNPDAYKSTWPRSLTAIAGKLTVLDGDRNTYEFPQARLRSRFAANAGRAMR